MQARQQPSRPKPARDLNPGDILIGSQGGQSVVVEEPSGNSGLIGFIRVETEHGHLFLETDAEVQVTGKDKE